MVLHLLMGMTVLCEKTIQYSKKYMQLKSFCFDYDLKVHSESKDDSDTGHVGSNNNLSADT